MEAIALIGTAAAAAAPAVGSAAATAGSAALSYAPLIAGGLTAAGSLYEGYRANQNAKFEAKQMKMKGDQELAAASHEARKARRERDSALSRARAVAAASGAGASDPSVHKLMAGIQTQGDYNSLTEMYRGFQRRDDLRLGAKLARMEGRDAFIGSALDAGASIYSGIERQRRYEE